MIAVLPINSAMFQSDAKIYGASYNKSTKAWTRTDLSQGYPDPTPAVGTGSGSSPFDSVYPWSGMQKETINGNALVKIPKFYLRVSNNTNSLSVQISDKKAPGFKVSPAHRDRGDGKGERDYIYVGRYLCDSTYHSKTNSALKLSDQRSDFRDGISKAVTGTWLIDYFTYITILYLYIVEFANWDSQATIGYGRSLNSSPNFFKSSELVLSNTGATDTMIYHTGTCGTTRSSNAEIQYRWIEGLWGNTWSWIDGINFYQQSDENKSGNTSGMSISVASNPSEYEEQRSNGTNGYIDMSPYYQNVNIENDISMKLYLIDDCISDSTNPEFIFPIGSTEITTSILTGFDEDDLTPESMANTMNNNMATYINGSTSNEIFYSDLDKERWGGLAVGGTAGTGSLGGLFSYYTKYFKGWDSEAIINVQDTGRIMYLP